MFWKRPLGHIRSDFNSVKSRFSVRGGSDDMAKDLARLMEQAGRHISDYQTKDEASALMDEIDKFRWDNALIVGNF